MRFFFSSSSSSSTQSRSSLQFPVLFPFCLYFLIYISFHQPFIVNSNFFSNSNQTKKKNQKSKKSNMISPLSTILPLSLLSLLVSAAPAPVQQGSVDLVLETAAISATAGEGDTATVITIPFNQLFNAACTSKFSFAFLPTDFSTLTKPSNPRRRLDFRLGRHQCPPRQRSYQMSSLCRRRRPHPPRRNFRSDHPRRFSLRRQARPNRLVVLFGRCWREGANRLHHLFSSRRQGIHHSNSTHPARF